MQSLYCCQRPTAPPLICYLCGPTWTKHVSLWPTADIWLSPGVGHVIGLEPTTQVYHTEQFLLPRKCFCLPFHLLNTFKELLILDYVRVGIPGDLTHSLASSDTCAYM